MALTGERTQHGEEVRAVLRYLVVTAIGRPTILKTMMARTRLQSLGHDAPLPPLPPYPPLSPWVTLAGACFQGSSISDMEDHTFYVELALKLHQFKTPGEDAV